MYSKADTHIHTSYSDGLMSPEETVEMIAAKTDLQIIAITDHDTTEGAWVAQAYADRQRLPLDVVIGQECSTLEGDVVGLFLKFTLPPFKTASETIEAIHAQGGLAIAVHPFSRWSTLNHMRGLGSKIFELPLDAVESRNGFPANFLSNPLTAWLNRALGQNLPELGGSDSHAPFTAGQSFTWFPGRSPADLRRAIESGAVRPAGPLWTTRSLARLTPLLFKQGLPHHLRAYSNS